MVVKDEKPPSRADLSNAQRALLDERLRRARQNGAKGGEAKPSIPRRSPEATDLPLSFAQERLWFLDQLEPGTPVYNLCQAVRMRGTLDLGALEKALNEIVRRHEILRTNFIAADGNPVQAIASTRTLTVDFVDASGAPAATREEEVLGRLREESRRSFDFVNGLLLRALVVRVTADEHVLMLTMHHIISDGWSIGVLYRELAALYVEYCGGVAAALPELSIQFADYALWEREQMQGPALESSLAFWKKQLGTGLPVLDLPTDRPHPATPTSRGALETLTLSPALSSALKTLSQKENSTLFMTLLAAFDVLLYRWTGQEDIVVGSVVAGRRKTEIEKLIGFFVNTVVLRGDLSGSPTFREVLIRVRDSSLAAFAHQDLPFERLVQELRPDRSSNRNPLFQVMFVLQNAPMAPAELPGLKLEPMDVDTGTTKFDLMLTMLESPQGLRAGFEYNAELFEVATIARMLRCFETLLESIVAQPDERIARLPLLTAAQRDQVVTGFNDTHTEYPRDRTIVELFEEQVARAPQAAALVFKGKQVSYRELNERADALALELRAAGVKPDALVGVCLERSVELIVALVAILKAGGAYVSLDPAYPGERLAFMLEDIQTPVLITRRELQGRLPAHAARVMLFDEVGRVVSGAPQSADSHASGAPARPTSDNLAYVSYTSGSTGKPKGVAVPHRGVVRLVKNTNFATFGAEDVFLQFAPIAFDASTLEIWGALLNGGRLVIVPPGMTSLAELGETIERNGVTTLWLTAGLFHQMIEEQATRLKNVRQLLAGGDVLSVSHVTRALEQLPQTKLINGYGPTENTTFTCCHRVSALPLAGRSVPIGRPIANTQVYILDREQQPVPVGVPGELYTGGDGLARGYLNRPELTAEKFVPDVFSADPGAKLYRTGDLARWLPDGSVEFLGRIDRQVKIRGFRVEPAEVEMILVTHPAIKECAVAVRSDAVGGKYLVAYLVAKQAPAPTSDVLRAFLAGKVPDYLVPSAFVALEALPLNANGKVDTAALPATDGARPELQGGYIAPRDEIEERLAKIWSAILGVNPVGVQDRFFDLGGHSLLAVRMVAQIEKQFGRRLPVSAIFQRRTIAELAPLLRTEEASFVSASSLVEIQGKGDRAPLYFVHGVGGGMFWGYANIAKYLGGERPVFAFKSRGLDGQPEWPTIEEMATHYLADLRAQQPHGPYLIAGYCFGGVVAYEMARQLDDAILHLRTNELEIGTWLLKTDGAVADVLAMDATLAAHAGHWF
ncbi:MAG: amino acid adenylation domain-containing protein, partial [Verrucomicrobiota bacterium]